MTYAYDRMGRRSAYIVGIVGDLDHSDSVWYRYQPTTGDLRTIGVRWRDITHSKDSVLFYWDPLGHRDSVRYTNGTILKFAYDGDGLRRVFCGSHPGDPSPYQDVLDFTVYNSSANRDGMILRTMFKDTGIGGCGQSDVSASYQANTFDSRHQVKTLDASLTVTSFVYDGSGNILRIRTPGWTDDVHTMDSTHNQLVRWRSVAKPDSGMDFFYNVNGSRREEVPVRGGTEHPFTDGHRQYFYDGLERLSGTATYIGAQRFGGPNDCTYDALGRLYDPCESGSTYLGFDGQNVVRTGSDGDAGWTFVHGPGLDDPIMGYFGSVSHGSDRHAYWITDGQGRQVSVADSAGRDFSDDYRYTFPQNGGKFAGGVGNATTFNADRFSNPEQPKLSFFRNRFYDQGTGRWTQEDPIGLVGGTNLYGFVGNNPVVYTDPFGLSKCGEIFERLKNKTKLLRNEWNKAQRAHGRKQFNRGHWLQLTGLRDGVDTELKEYEREGCKDKKGNDDDFDGGSPDAQGVVIQAGDYVKRPIPDPDTLNFDAGNCSTAVRAGALATAIASFLEDILTAGAGVVDDPVTAVPAMGVFLVCSP